MSEGILAVTSVRRSHPRRKFAWRFAERPITWLLPLALVLVVSYLFPAIDVVRFSFTDATLLNPDYQYTLRSYRAVSQNADMPQILRATGAFVVTSVICQLGLGLLVAMALHRGVRRQLWGVSFLRIVILSSWIVPGVASGIVWALMFNEASYGFLNGVLRLMGFPAVAWLSDPNIAIWSAVLANVWRGTAFSMILLYAGLLVIPPSLYEAAEVDGATAIKQFRHITLPQLRPILLVNTILISIFTLNSFDLILPLTGGGPGRATEVLALYAYNTVFRNFDLSNGSVLAVILLLISVAFTVFYVRLLPKEA
jgi:multiple sugar transport system permease protein